jgi:N-acylneuraminate cytidylyltransferase
MGNNKVAIITARGGSKRIPRKNIKPFLGHPIIKYSIDAALQSGCFDEVMVSTDDKEIADIALSLGAKVPFSRSAKTSDDYATTCDVLEEVILEYRKLGKDFDYLCCIYPTAPFVTGEKIKKGMQLLQERGADCVLPIVRFSYPIQRSLKIEDGKTMMIWPENYLARSQDLMPAYHDCGQFYCMKTESMLKQMRLFAEFTIPLETPEMEVQDIDNEEDWKIAEIKYGFLLNKLAKGNV